ncbi:kelch-like protein 25 isoform X2 [Syngnathus scovelli]|uniref:kelch-like protein 25 isoform X2 n=1 Tax=Syngnathus scovelli TaxID=161590 RepID=UPI0035CAD061
MEHQKPFPEHHFHTHRELDWSGDVEGKSHGTLHWLAETDYYEEQSAYNPATCFLPKSGAKLYVLELLLDYAYTSRVIINEENAESLLEAGDMLQFHDIRDAAAQFLEKNLHSSNCLGMMLLSDAHQCRRLYELSWRMCLLHYETIRESEDFNSLTKEKLLDLVLSDELEIEDEQVVFNSVMRWVQNDLDNRRHHLPELLQGIRLALLPSECLLEAVACEELVMADKKSRVIVEEAMQCKKRILQNDGVVTSPCARPRKAGHTLLILGGQTFMCDKIYQVKCEANILP